MVDRDGRLLRELARAGGGRAAWAPLSSLPPSLIAATLAGEDRRFFAHHGVDAAALVRAAWLDVRGERLAFGGSTITMQLVRLVEPHPRTLAGKLGEVVRALRLERAVGKRQILEQYLNRAYYGAGAWGVEAAAQQYFGKPAAALSDGEALLLATLPRAPQRYDLRAHPAVALARRAHLLQLLVASGALDAAARARIEATPIGLRAAPAVDPHQFRAPHFVDWVLAQLDDEARARGGIVHTTLDLPLEQRAEELVREHVRALAGDGVNQAGLVILDAATGDVRAMVGSPDYFAPLGQVNIATTPRNPGSALKPFTYALALEQGDSPASIAFDVDLPGSRYHPRNADGRQHGPVRYREALACSYNLAAVHVAERVGVGALLERLRAAGLDTLDGDPERYGPALTLGAGPVRLVDLAAAYAFVVDGGVMRRPRAVTRIEAATGEGRDLSPSAPRRLFSPEVSWLVMDMLADAEARRPAFGDDLPLDLPFPVAAKTGTSGGFSDNVTVIATREFIVAAWAGNFDGRPMHNMMAMWGAAPLARAAILAAAGERSPTLPSRPARIVARPVCALSGLAPTAACQRRREWFIDGAAPRPCDWHRGEAVAWPGEVASWAARRRDAGGQRAPQAR